jgi:heterodisulfide reductase subunit A
MNDEPRPGGVAAEREDAEAGASKRRIGVYVCHCGGNISDYVDVDKVVASVQGDPDVILAKTAMFTCSDASQQEIIKDIQENNLDGIVVASCSPKLHTYTFRDVARRAGLSPYQYTQVNIREQCSWTHTDDCDGATGKATQLVKAGIGRTRFTVPLEPIVVETVPKAVVIGGGIAGLRSALGLAEIGLGVFLVEREARLGGWAGEFGDMYPHGKNGKALVGGLIERIRKHPGITVFTNAEVVGKSGSFGNYEVAIRVSSATPTGAGTTPLADGASTAPETITVQAGSIIVATGFDVYRLAENEFGYGLEGVITLPDFKRLLDSSDGALRYAGRPVEDIVYIYCVGSRQTDGRENANEYCSRYCCTAAAHASIEAADKSGRVHQYHLHRDVRTYGKYELLYIESLSKGSVYLKVPDDEPPVVRRDPRSGKLLVTARDLLSEGEEIEIPADLVVLVTGMVPRANDELVKTLKLPIGRGGFFNEIHPKLRPVETVVDGVYICGACQGPKNSAEAVASGLAAVTQSASILKRGFAELDPLVAVVDTDLCEWCGACLEACPYEAPRQVAEDGKAVAFIDKTTCKGCGGCVPVCPKDAIDLEGYTDAQIKAMIDGLLMEVKA